MAQGTTPPSGTAAEPKQVSELADLTAAATQLPGSYLLADVPNPAYNPVNPGTTKRFLTRRVAYAVLVQLLQTTGAPTNGQRGTPKIVLYESSTEAGVGPNDTTLDRLASSVLCAGTTVTVLLPTVHQLVLAKDPTGPLTVATDGSFQGPTTQARWVVPGEAYAVGEVAFSPLTAEYAAGARVNTRVNGVLRLFSAAALLHRVDFPGNLIPVPGSTGDWEEVSPPDSAAAYTAFQRISQASAIDFIENGVVNAARLYAITIDAQEVWVWGLDNGVFSGVGEILDPNDAERTIPVSVDVRAGTVKPLLPELFALGFDAAASNVTATFGSNGKLVLTSASAPAAPAAPTVAFNASLRLLTAAHALGTAELEYRHGSNGAVLPYAPLSIDGNTHVAGEWQFRVKAAAGRPVSDWANSPFIGAATGRRALGLGGQSNIEGTTFGSFLAGSQLSGRSLTRELSNTYISYSGTLQKLHFGFNQYGGPPEHGIGADSSFGLEIGLGDAMDTLAPNDRLDIWKYGVGGQHIGDMQKTASTGYYAELISRMNVVKTAWLADSLAWASDFVFGQGESGGNASNWPAQTKQFLDDLTADDAIQANSRIFVLIPKASVDGDTAGMWANCFALTALDSRVELIDLRHYTLQDAYHYEGIPMVHLGFYELFNRLRSIPFSAPSFFSAQQSYSTTPADYAAKCGAGSGPSITKARQVVSFVSEADAATLSLAAATQDAKTGIVCGIAPVGVVKNSEFADPVVSDQSQGFVGSGGVNIANGQAVFNNTNGGDLRQDVTLEPSSSYHIEYNILAISGGDIVLLTDPGSGAIQMHPAYGIVTSTPGVKSRDFTTGINDLNYTLYLRGVAGATGTVPGGTGNATGTVDYLRITKN